MLPIFKLDCNTGIERLSLDDKNAAADISKIEKQQQIQEHLQRKLLEIQSHNRVLEEQQQQLQQDIQEQQQRWAQQKLLQEQDRDTKVSNKGNIISDNKQIKLDENDTLTHQRLHAREKLLDESKDANDQVANDIQEDQMQWARQKLLEQKNNSDKTKVNPVEDSSNNAETESNDILVTSDKVKQYQKSILRKEVSDGKRSHKVLTFSKSPLSISTSGRSNHIEELEAKLFSEKKELEDLKYQLEQQRLLYNQEKRSRDKKPTDNDFLVNDIESKMQPTTTDQPDSLKTWLDEFAIENMASEQNLLPDTNMASRNNNLTDNKFTETTMLDQISGINNAEEIQFLNFRKNLDSMDKETVTINNNLSRVDRNIVNDNYDFKLSPVPEEAESDISNYTGLDPLRGNNRIENELNHKEIITNDLINLSNDANILPQTIQLISASNVDEEIPTELEPNHQYQQLEELSDIVVNLNSDPQFEIDTKLSSYTLSSDASPNSESDHVSAKHLPENLLKEDVADVQLSFDTIFSSYPIELTAQNQRPTVASRINKERLESDEIVEELIAGKPDRNFSINANENDVILSKDENLKVKDFITYSEVQTNTLKENKKSIEQTEEHIEHEADNDIIFKEEEDLQYQDIQSNDSFVAWDVNASSNRIREDKNVEKVTLQDAFFKNKKGFIKKSKSRSQTWKKRGTAIEQVYSY